MITIDHADQNSMIGISLEMVQGNCKKNPTFSLVQLNRTSVLHPAICLDPDKTIASNDCSSVSE